MAILKKKRIKLTRIEASAAVKALYQKKLKAEIKAMRRSVEYFLTNRLRNASAAVRDANPVDDVQREINRLKRQYAKRFGILAKDLPPQIVKQILRDADRRFGAKIKAAAPDLIEGIKLSFTPAMRAKIKAMIGQNVSLIRTLPQEYFGRIENTIMSGIRNNEGTAPLFRQLIKDYQITENRAALIATDQTDKIHEEIMNQRAKDIGVKRGIWRHSGTSRVARKGHLEADGKEYDIDKGCYIDGEYIKPKEKINCQCFVEYILEI